MDVRGVIVRKQSEAVDDFLESVGAVNRIYVAAPPTPRQHDLRRTRPDLKILHYDATTRFSDIVWQGQRAVQHFVDDTVGRVAARDCDGVLLHWRAPGFNSDTGKESARPVAEGFDYVNLLLALKKALPQGMELAVVLPVATPHVRRILAYLADMKPHVSHFVVAGFDGDWMAPRACHASALRPLLNVAVTMYCRVLWPKKLVIGIPGYATVFDGCEGFDRPFAAKRVAECPDNAIGVRDALSGSMPISDERIGSVVVYEDRISLDCKRTFIEESGLGGAALVFDQPPPRLDLAAVWGVVPPSPIPEPAAPPMSAPVGVPTAAAEGPISAPGSLLFPSLAERPPSLLVLPEPAAPSPPPRKASLLAAPTPSSGTRSEWTPMDPYRTGDIVTLGKMTFVCRAEHVPPSLPFLRPDLWQHLAAPNISS